nr:unnamed protein product [Callosobruchus chinensis]
MDLNTNQDSDATVGDQTATSGQEKVGRIGKGKEGSTTDLRRKWPEIAFRTVKEVEENSFKISQRHDIILFLDPRQKYDKGIIQDALKRFPNQRYYQRWLRRGKIEYIINETRTSLKKNSEEDRTAVYILPCNIDKRGVNDMEGIFNLLVNRRDEVLSNVPKKLILVTPPELDRLYVRNIAEFVMHGRRKKVDYFHPTQKRPEMGTEEFEETKAGDLLLNIEGKGMAEALGEAIKNKSPIQRLPSDRIRKPPLSQISTLLQPRKRLQLHRNDWWVQILKDHLNCYLSPSEGMEVIDRKMECLDDAIRDLYGGLGNSCGSDGGQIGSDSSKHWCINYLPAKWISTNNLIPRADRQPMTPNPTAGCIVSKLNHAKFMKKFNNQPFLSILESPIK